jgi:hypothetical protein
MTKMGSFRLFTRSSNLLLLPLKKGAGGNFPVEAGFVAVARVMGDSEENR